MPQAISIDNFMDDHRKDKAIETCGKLAIVRTILQAEANSTLFIKQQDRDIWQLPFVELESTWFGSFFKQLIKWKSSDLAKRLSSVVLVIFNYDRCIEHYLYYAIQNYFSMSASAAVSLLQHLEIYHPYGSVGSLPWFNPQNAIEYGATTNPAQLLRLTSQIKTFTEGTDESSGDVIAIRSHMRTSHRLVFLGFAFHPLNMDLLSPNTGLSSPTGRSGFATTHGISDNDIGAIINDLELRGVLSRGQNQIHMELTCSALFKEYSRLLSFP